MLDSAEDPRYAAYAYLLFRGRFADASEIDLDPHVPICGEVFDRTYGAEGAALGAKRQVCVKPTGHLDKTDAEVALMVDRRSRRELAGIYRWRHRGWQITPLTHDDQLGKYGYCSMVW